MRNHRVNGVLILVGVGLMGMVGVPGHGRTQSIDPLSLLGEWVGTWQGKLASASGPYRLTIEAIDGDKVRGHVETTGGLNNTTRRPRSRSEACSAGTI